MGLWPTYGDENAFWTVAPHPDVALLTGQSRSKRESELKCFRVSRLAGSKSALTGSNLLRAANQLRGLDLRFGACKDWPVKAHTLVRAVSALKRVPVPA